MDWAHSVIKAVKIALSAVVILMSAICKPAVNYLFVSCQAYSKPLLYTEVKEVNNENQSPFRSSYINAINNGSGHRLQFLCVE